MNDDLIIPLGTRHPSPCPNCGASLYLVPNANYGAYYRCVNHPFCDGTASAHGDGRPMGKPVTNNIKAARILTHKYLELLEHYGASRAWIYRTFLPGITKQQNIHISDMDFGQLKAVIREAQKWLKN